MPKPQVITSPNGDEMVIIPKAEYDHLVRRPMTEAEEDEADARSASEILGRIKRGEEETFPFAIIKRIGSGESAIKVYREHRSLTQKQLAAKVGINPVYLSQIETGVKNGSFETISGIARALRVGIELIAPARLDQRTADEIAQALEHDVNSEKKIRGIVRKYWESPDIALSDQEARNTHLRRLKDCLRVASEQYLSIGNVRMSRAIDRLVKTRSLLMR